MKKVALIGSTGSIGRQTLNVLRRNKENFRLVCAVAGSSYAEFSAQLNEFKPPFAALVNADCAKKVELPASTALFSGEEGALSALNQCGADIIVVACGGFNGLKYSLAAAKLNARLALANKETLVCGGDLFAHSPCEIVPVDSEHSAIWQCLNFRRNADVAGIYLTASGGAFRGKKWSELSGVTPAQALAHPTWNMGAKITVDSATLLNKGYEVIEAHHLYSLPYEKITAVIQRQSVIHSMVKFHDGAILAQLSRPTMELPIQLALTYPERVDCNLTDLDFSKPFSLDFEPLVRADYPMFDLALTCGEAGGTLPTVLNGAAEVAVGAFLNGEISYTDIYAVTAAAVEGAENCPVESYAALECADVEARSAARIYINKIKR